MIRKIGRSTFRSLSNRNYRLYFVGQVISVSGTWMQSFALGWYVLDISHQNALDLGVITAIQFLPMLLFGAWAGLIVDRSDKQKLLMATQILFMVIAIGLGISVQTGHGKVYLVGFFALLLGLVNMFDNPCRQAFVQEMVGGDLVTNAVSLNSVIMNAARVIGPGAGGLIIGFLGVDLCFYINAASFVAVLVALLLMNPDELIRKSPVTRAPHQLRDGFKYVLQNKNLKIPLIMMGVVGTLAYNFQVTLLLFARSTFHLHAAHSGLLFSYMGLGAVIGGLTVASRKNPGPFWYIVSGLIFGFLLLVLAFSPNILIAELFLVPVGASSIAYVAISNSTLQLRSDPQMRGRVMSLYAIAFLGTTPIGSLIVSVIANYSNPRWALLVGAVGTLTAAIFAYIFSDKSTTKNELIKSKAEG
jgi:MFS family permease